MYGKIAVKYAITPEDLVPLKIVIYTIVHAAKRLRIRGTLFNPPNSSKPPPFILRL
jgi:hypothetical protein